MVDIAATILRKVERSAVFVADVTTVARPDKGWALQNPNVLIELGFAMKALTPERVVLVANEALGFKPKGLPFDIHHRRDPRSSTSSKRTPDRTKHIHNATHGLTHSSPRSGLS